MGFTCVVVLRADAPIHHVALTRIQLSFFSDSESGPRLLAPLYDRFRQAGTLLRSSEDGSMIVQAILDVVVDEALDITEAFRCATVPSRFADPHAGASSPASSRASSLRLACPRRGQSAKLSIVRLVDRPLSID